MTQLAVNSEFESQLEDLGFSYDMGTGSWRASCLDFNTFGPVCGLEECEYLAVDYRISRTLDRLDLVVAREDLAGLLALNHVDNPELSATVGDVVAFWADNPKFTMTATADEVTLSLPIEDSRESLATEMNPAYFAFTCAINSALRGESRADIATRDEGFYDRGFLERLEKPSGQTGLSTVESLRASLEDNGPDYRHVFREREVRPERPLAPESLRELRLDIAEREPEDGDWRDRGYSVSRTKGMVQFKGAEAETSPSLSGHNDQITLHLGLWSQDLPEHAIRDVLLAEGPDHGVKTPGDLEKITSVTLRQVGDLPDIEITDAVIEVSDTGFSLTSKEAEFSVEFEVIHCESCGDPYWNFPLVVEVEPVASWVSEEEFPNGSSVMDATGHLFWTDIEEGHEACYCAGCIREVVTDYTDQHPTALRSEAQKSIQTAVADKIAEFDLELTDVYRESGLDEDSSFRGWEAYFFMRYERDGRQITRFAGTVAVTDDGEVTNNLKPDEYLRFRA